ncbi:MAG: DUF4238 domain-containing protein [Sandaracinaceae bacterium]|nr:DUF4238 domain-containing protein [Sandaracinaceae bacterium]
MSGHKRQHFVPQSYLRRFAADGTDGRAISTLLVKTGKHVPRASIATACQAEYFYGKDLAFEHALRAIEAAADPVISSVVAEAGVPEPTSAEMTSLLRFVGLQMGRTPDRLRLHSEQETAWMRMAARTHPEFPKQFGDTIDRVSVRVPDEWIAVALSIANDGIPLICDLRAKVLVSRTACFITSDSPVVLHNRWAGPNAQAAVGLTSRGLLVFMPLSPRHLLVLFDTDVYRVGASFADYVEVNDEEEIFALNALQAEGAAEQIIYASHMPKVAVDRLGSVPKRGPRWNAQRVWTPDNRNIVVTAQVSSSLKLPSGGSVRIRPEVEGVPRHARWNREREGTTELFRIMKKFDEARLSRASRVERARRAR